VDGDNAGGRALPGGARCCRQRTAGAMGGYELVRSDDAAGAGGGADLESGAAKGAVSIARAPAPAAARQRLASLDVFRGITVLVRARN
jgi:hypothetical protein